MRSPEILKQMAGFNKVINGNFDYWQRSVAVNIAVNTYSFVTDRFRGQNYGSHTNSLLYQQSGTSPNLYSSHCPVLSVSSSSATQSDTRRALITPIEGYVFQPLLGKNFTLSFWVRSSKIGKYSVSFNNTGSSKSYVAEYEVLAADTWERKSISVLHDSSGTWDVSNGMGLLVRFGLSLGSNYTTSTLNSWIDGDYRGSTTAVNWGDISGDTIRFSQIMLHEGKEALDSYVYAGGDAIIELRLCQRYYEKSYEIVTVPGTTTYTGSFTSKKLDNSSSGTQKYNFLYSAVKRDTPSLLKYSPETGAVDMTRVTNPAGDTSVDVMSYPSMRGFQFGISSNAVNAGGSIYSHWTADAELT